MKQLFLLLIFLFFRPFTASPQNGLMVLKDALPQIEKGGYKGIILNDSLVYKFISEYLQEAKKRDIDLYSSIEDINWILIEPESNQPPELTGMILAKIDKDRKLILLSKSCLLDRNILQATLFRELSHYLGLPYNIECCEIMRVKKPKGYSYSWIDDYDIREITYENLFTELKKFIDY